MTTRSILLLLIITIAGITAKAQCSIRPIIGSVVVSVGSSITLTDSTSGGAWMSSDTSIAIIGSTTGIVTGRTNGYVTITYFLSASCYTTRVIQIKPGFSGRTKLCVGDTTTLQNAISGVGSWSVSDPSVASVDIATGHVIALVTGNAVITHSFIALGIAYSAVDTIRVATVTSVSIATDTALLCSNQRLTIASVPAVTWQSRNSGIVRIDSSTYATAYTFGVAVGSTKIDVISEYCLSVRDSVYAIVRQAPVPVSIGPGNPCVSGGGWLSLCSGQSKVMGITSYATVNGYWSTSDSTVAVMHDAFGSGNCYGATVTALHPADTAYILLYFNAIGSNGCSTLLGGGFHIWPQLAPTNTIVGPPVINQGETQLYTAPGAYSWYISPVTVATITSNYSTGYNGSVTAIAPGTATISHFITDHCQVTSSNKTITVMPSSYVAVCPTFSSFVTSLCSSTQLGIIMPAHTTSYSLITSYGDGHKDTSVVSAATDTVLTTFSHIYSSSGTYSIKQVLYDLSVPVDSVVYSYERLICRDVAMSFYIDNNSNCNFDSTTEFLNHSSLQIRVDSNGIAVDTMSATSGMYYTVSGPTGTIYSFSVFGLDSALSFSCPSSGIVRDTLTATGWTTAHKSVALNCTSVPGFDLRQQTSLRAGRHRASGIIAVRNSRCLAQNAIVTLDISPKYVLNTLYTSPMPTSVVGNRATWNFSGVSLTNIPPIISYDLIVPTPVWLTPGDTVHNSIAVGPVTGDVDTSNNVIIRIDTVKSSYDPNHIEVSPSGYIFNGQRLAYTIEFENDGNDTAQNIYVMDTLSDLLNISTLRLNAASATMNISILHSGGHNILKFDFPGIKLLDSSHHGQCTGFVSYSINARSGLVDGADIISHAGIYFDDNPVVLTDTAYNRVIIPQISVSASSDTICNGQSILCNAMAHSSENTHYKWYLNSVVVGSDSSAITIPAINGGDILKCKLSTIIDDTLYTWSNNILFINRGMPSPGVISGPSSVCVAASISLAETVAPGTWSVTNSHASISGNIVTGITSGSDTIKYSVANACGTTTTIFPVIINPLPDAGVISGSAILCEGAITSLGNTASGGAWSMTNGHANNIANIITGVTAGADTALYVVSTVCGSDTARFAMAINPLPVAGTIGGPSAVCVGTSISLTSTSTGGTWSLTNSHASHSGGTINGVTAGLDTAIYVVTNSCGAISASHIVTIHPLPYAGTITGSASVCIGSAITLTDSIAGGSWALTNVHASHVGSVVTGVSAGTDTMIYTITNYCGVATTRKVITVNSIVVPAISVSNIPGDTICAGDTLHFTATSVNGGTSPTYVWRNFITVIGTGSTFNYVAGAGNIITCALLSSAPCPASDTVYSAPEIIMVIPVVTPVVTINSSVGDSISYIGQTVTFHSSLTYGGSAPTYQWFNNNLPVAGATSNSYAKEVTENDTFFCVATSNVPCATRSSDTSDMIVIYGNYLQANGVNIYTSNTVVVYPNPTKGKLYIQGILPNTNMKLFDVTGKYLSDVIITANGGNADLSNYPPGVYIIELLDDYGNRQFLRVVRE